MFSLFSFFIHFSMGLADPICPYVRTPMGPVGPISSTKNGGRESLPCFFPGAENRITVYLCHCILGLLKRLLTLVYFLQISLNRLYQNVGLYNFRQF